MKTEKINFSKSNKYLDNFCTFVFIFCTVIGILFLDPDIINIIKIKKWSVWFIILVLSVLFSSKRALKKMEEWKKSPIKENTITSRWGNCVIYFISICFLIAISAIEKTTYLKIFLFFITIFLFLFIFRREIKKGLHSPYWKDSSKKFEET